MKEKKENNQKGSQLQIEFSSNVVAKQTTIQSSNIEVGKVIRLSDNTNKSKPDYSGLVLKYTKSF